ncbi:MAG: DNA recombination protein RmuC, partial [Planctomycetota bacterium]
MMEFLWILFGMSLGLAIGHLLGQKRARGLAESEAQLARAREEGLLQRTVELDKELAAANAKSETLSATFEAEKRTAKDLRQELRDSFQALAGQALKDNSRSLLEKTDLQLKPFQEQLKSLAEQTRELEEARGKAQGALKQQLKDLQDSTRDLSLKSESLTGALRGSSQARGQWGETVLQRVFELAGMQEGMHFRTQETSADGLRPDFLVLLPGGDAIPADSKVPLAAFLDAQAEQDPVRRKEFLLQHARDVQKHVRTLARKEYSAGVEGDVDFTVMFLPGDHLLEAAYQADPRLQEEAMEKGILIATPVTLLALLRTVSLYWRQESLAKNAREIASLAQEYHNRMRKFTEHMAKAGKGLHGAVRSYNDAVSSYSRRVLPQGRRLEELA